MFYDKYMYKRYWPGMILLFIGWMLFYIGGLPYYVPYIFIAAGGVLMCVIGYMQIGKDPVKKGFLALAFIDSYLQIYKYDDGRRQFHFDLTVVQADGQLFMAKTRQLLSPSDIAKLKNSAFVPVMVNEKRELRLAKNEEIDQNVLDGILSTLSNHKERLNSSQIELLEQTLAGEKSILHLS